jgi:hypothetical protein
LVARPIQGGWATNGLRDGSLPREGPEDHATVGGDGTGTGRRSYGFAQESSATAGQRRDAI